MKLFRLFAAVALVVMSATHPPRPTKEKSPEPYATERRVRRRREGHGEERADRRRAQAVSNEQGYFLIRLKPSSYTIKTEKTGFAAIEYTAMPLAVGQELALDFEFKPAGVTEDVTVVGTAPVLDLSSARIGVNVSEREVDRLPVNGRQMSQLMLQAPGSQNAGHRHMAGHPVLRTRRRAERDPIRRHRRVGDHRRSAGQPERRGRDAVQAAGEPRERPGIPRRVERLSRRIRHRQRRPGQRHHQVGQQRLPRRRVRVPAQRQARCAELLRQRDRWPDLPQVAARSRISSADRIGGPIAEEPGVLLRQLRSVPAERRHQHRRSGAERRRLGARRAGDRRAARRLPGAGRRHSPRPVDESRLRHRATADAAGGARKRRSAAGSTSGSATDWSSYVRVFHDQGTSDAPDSVSGPRHSHRGQPEQRRLQSAGACCRTGRPTSSSSATTRAHHEIAGDVPAVSGVDFSPLILNLTGSVANNGIAGQGSSSGITVPGGLVRVEQRAERPRASRTTRTRCRSSIR